MRGAHKLTSVREPEQGLSCFVVGLVAYSRCYFGCCWAAYWFSRAGGFAVRQLHIFLWICQGLFLCVDGGFSLAVLRVIFSLRLGDSVELGETSFWRDSRLASVGLVFFLREVPCCLTGAQRRTTKPSRAARRLCWEGSCGFAGHTVTEAGQQAKHDGRPWQGLATTLAG